MSLAGHLAAAWKDTPTRRRYFASLDSRYQVRPARAASGDSRWQQSGQDGGQMKSQNLTPIYLKAMDKIENNVENHSCPAIAHNYNYDPAAQLYAKIFSPDGRCGSIQDPFALAVNSGPDPKGHRLTMLALVSVCWRDFV